MGRGRGRGRYHRSRGRGRDRSRRSRSRSVDWGRSYRCSSRSRGGRGKFPKR